MTDYMKKKDQQKMQKMKRHFVSIENSISDFLGELGRFHSRLSEASIDRIQDSKKTLTEFGESYAHVRGLFDYCLRSLENTERYAIKQEIAREKGSEKNIS